MLESSYLKEQFEKEYDRAVWSKILREILNATLLAMPKNLDLKRNDWGATGYELGSFETLEGRQVGIFEITVPTDAKLKLKDNRKGLRDLLKNEVYRDQVDAALLVFKQDKKWRFSYVSQIRVYNKETGKRELKATESKRYTYLMGVGERCLTAAKQFTKIQMDANLFGKGVTLETIHNAFSVEKMSKEFFDEYRKHYGAFTSFLTGDDENNKTRSIPSDYLQNVFHEDKKLARDFIKKLLGRIVFLYFLEKKGWLGVQQGLDWGEGDPDFLSNLFKYCKNKDRFYSDVLIPLFYDTLNKERKGDLFSIDDAIFTKLGFGSLKIPYLNGGLFEKDGSTSDRIKFPRQLFESLFAFFDQYNFTVYEDSPDEHTVAVDPEMLGHIFENLLEDNKDKGAFYTPKEVVHYMCQESLVEYLFSKLDGYLERQDIERFIKHQEFSGVVSYLEEILQLLYDIKVCDPAIGSGAFPMGILIEIFHAVEAIHDFNKDTTERIWKIEGWEPAKVKAAIIQHSIYGVDIEQGAVDIARLRFWLSLVVDEDEPQPLPNLDYKIVVGDSLVSKFDNQVIEIDWTLAIPGAVTDEVKRIRNKQKSLQGKLQLLLQKQNDFFDHKGDKTALKEEIRKLKIDVLIEHMQLTISKENLIAKPIPLYGNSESKPKKEPDGSALLKKDSLEKAILKLGLLRNSAQSPLHFFDWKFDFPEIMNEQLVDKEVGFDIVIGNPPYVGQKGHKEMFQEIKDTELGKQYHQRRMDLFYFFFHKGIILLKPGATLTFITTNYFLTATYSDKLRKHLFEETTILSLINFNELKIFESAQGQHNLITVLNKGKIERIAKTAITQLAGHANEQDIARIINGNDKDTLYYPQTQSSLFEKNTLYIRIGTAAELSGGPQTVFSVLNKISSDSEALSKYCNIEQGIVSGADKVSDSHISEYPKYNFQKGKGIFVLKSEEIDELQFSVADRKHLKKTYKNSEIKKWIFSASDLLNVIYIKSDGSYQEPSIGIKNHLDHYKIILINRNVRVGSITESEYQEFLNGRREISYIMNASSMKKGNYYCLSYPRREKKTFEVPKIVNSRRAHSNIFALEENGYYEQSDIVVTTLKTEFCSSIDIKFLLSVLNSKLIYHWFFHKGKRKGDMLELFQKPISEVPIKLGNSELQSKIVSLANDIIHLKKENSSATVADLEAKIDHLVYKLYELTYDEASIIEGNTEWMSREDYEKQL